PANARLVQTICGRPTILHLAVPGVPPEARLRRSHPPVSGRPADKVHGTAFRNTRGKMRTTPKQGKHSAFLIIRGGMVGMAARAEARRQGINAICLEAASKIGGRIRTARNRRVAPYPIELGAEFVHGPLMRQLCESLGLTLVKHPSD